MMLTSIFIATIAGIARGLAPTYTTFVIFEFLDKALASGFFYGAFIIGKFSIHFKFYKYLLKHF